MGRRLQTIAKYINDHSARLGGIQARVEKSSASTDRKLAGSRLRIPGKGRTGNRLKVWHAETKELVLDHNSAETYRTNEEVERWLSAWENGDRRRWSWSGNKYKPGEGGLKVW